MGQAHSTGSSIWSTMRCVAYYRPVPSDHGTMWCTFTHAENLQNATGIGERIISWSHGCTGPAEVDRVFHCARRCPYISHSAPVHRLGVQLAQWHPAVPGRTVAGDDHQRD